MLEHEEVVELCEARIKYCVDNSNKAEAEGKFVEALTWSKAAVEIQYLYMDMLSRIKDKLEKEFIGRNLRNKKESA